MLFLTFRLHATRARRTASLFLYIILPELAFYHIDVSHVLGVSLFGSHGLVLNNFACAHDTNAQVQLINQYQERDMDGGRG